ncbi:lipopolysaccharide-induced tumor necrosis factor-alpha factor [Diachasma alloeum]|uniref:lipopolysaccharide-induced tumor necrosis factor-alpha factor n=1 Tax=Diachasma alloeum TaxID=454923 RepID=UPI0007382390|nr:lipopolysaccharide-induced tumor necrosis factor-alpha factor [Diachasma alloeum]XP_015110437.1 lipopolysaccharide-induced tumor necrosis factor-alpha factor [Diachasma alloeum]XP_015110438.1 lipopolysaccharide-induced tumor necrosis factor-alpha factor [Diachasma alloeum]
MEKNQSTMSTSEPAPTAPPPSPTALPPSYEEAIAQSMGMTNPSINGTPYLQSNSTVSVSTPSVQPTVHMPRPHQPDVTDGCDTQFAPPSYAITSELRVIRGRAAYVLAPGPLKMQCPSCMADIKTSTVSDHQPMAHVCCLILCVIGCCLCSCLPYCMTFFMKVHHFCPRCRIYIGTWKGFEPSQRLIALRV